MRIGGTLAIAAALAMSGCGDDYVTDSRASVLLIVESVNGGSPILSDVRSGTATSQTIVNCDVDITALSLPKNPAIEGEALENIVLSSYRIRYRRSDGRDVQGVDVPHEISGPVTQTLFPRQTTVFPVTLVRHQAKIEPPLDAITELDLVTMSAEITLYGRTVNGDEVSGTGAVQITFADFAEGSETCESN